MLEGSPVKWRLKAQKPQKELTAKSQHVGMLRARVATLTSSKSCENFGAHVRALAS